MPWVRIDHCLTRERSLTLPYNEVVPKSKELEVRLQRTDQQLRLFQKVSRFMVRDMSLQDVLQGIVSLVVSGADPKEVVRRGRAAGVVVSARAGRLRVSPHFYNTPADIDRLFSVLTGTHS